MAQPSQLVSRQSCLQSMAWQKLSQHPCALLNSAICNQELIRMKSLLTLDWLVDCLIQLIDGIVHQKVFIRISIYKVCMIFFFKISVMVWTVLRSRPSCQATSRSPAIHPTSPTLTSNVPISSAPQRHELLSLSEEGGGGRRGLIKCQTN